MIFMAPWASLLMAAGRPILMHISLDRVALRDCAVDAGQESSGSARGDSVAAAASKRARVKNIACVDTLQSGTRDGGGRFVLYSVSSGIWRRRLSPVPFQ